MLCEPPRQGQSTRRPRAPGSAPGTRPRKRRTVSAQRLSLAALAERIADGALLAVPPDYSGCAMAAVRALLRRPVRGLRLLGVPQAGLQADLLVGAGCVAELEAAAVGLGEHGGAPRFNAAVRSGALHIRDSTCPVIHAGLQAAEKGLPFMPLRGVLGSDLVAHRPDWRIIDNPFDADDPILAVPAIRPDVALFHAPMADTAGNVWIGVRRELMTMAHAARTTLVTVERVVEEDLLADPRTAAGVIPALYVSAFAQVSRGAWPLALFASYAADRQTLAGYARAATTESGFADWLATHLAQADAA